MVSIMENQALKLTFKEKRFLGICKLNKLNSFVEYNVVFSIWLCNVSGNIWVLLYQKSLFPSFSCFCKFSLLFEILVTGNSVAGNFSGNKNGHCKTINGFCAE